MLSWIFGSSDEDAPPSSYSPPTITGCSAINFTHYDSMEETFTTIQKAFDLARGKPHDKFARSYSAMQVPFEVVSDPNAIWGHAVVAKENVPEGTKVWKDWHFVNFSAKNPKKFYRFLEQLSLKHQCLILSMTHASYDGQSLELAMDEGNFIQDAQYPEQVNSDLHCVAQRDIAAGERFYMNYSEYVGYDHEIDWFDDLRYDAFREGKLRGGASASPSMAAATWLERPQNLDSRSADARANGGYPSFLWPTTLIILLAMFAIKKAAATSRQDGFNKNKLC
jgi:hypothetical protein